MCFLRRALAASTAVALWIPALPVGAAGDSIAQAEARVAAARGAAYEASARYEEANGRLWELDTEIARTRQGIEATKQEADRLRLVATRRAVEAYKGGGNLDLVVMVSGGDVLDAVRRTELLDRANANDDDAVDRLGAISEELYIRQGELAARIEEQQALVADLEERERALYNALAQAEAAEQDLRERKALEDAAARVALAARQSASVGGGAGQIIVNPGGGSFVCPVQGAVAFTDTWGAPRSGGRRHQGVDMMAGYGTPVVAVTSGSISQSYSSLGGTTIWLSGSNGSSYYYAHLQGYVGGPRSVSAGEMIATVGDSGNARGTPHLHFEIHPGGGGAIDPYPTVAQYC